MEAWKPISVGAHTLQKKYFIYNEAVYRMKFRSDIYNLPKIRFQDPKVIHLSGPKFVSFPVPRYLLVSQSSIPALQAM